MSIDGGACGGALSGTDSRSSSDLAPVRSMTCDLASAPPGVGTAGSHPIFAGWFKISMSELLDAWSALPVSRISTVHLNLPQVVVGCAVFSVENEILPKALGPFGLGDSHFSVQIQIRQALHSLLHISSGQHPFAILTCVTFQCRSPLGYALSFYAFPESLHSAASEGEEISSINAAVLLHVLPLHWHSLFHRCHQNLMLIHRHHPM